MFHFWSNKMHENKLLMKTTINFLLLQQEFAACNKSTWLSVGRLLANMQQIRMKYRELERKNSEREKLMRDIYEKWTVNSHWTLWIIHYLFFKRWVYSLVYAFGIASNVIKVNKYA